MAESRQIIASALGAAATGSRIARAARRRPLLDHSMYDMRRYPIVGVREGYGEWVRTYEATVHDLMDLRLLERLQSIDWKALRLVLDLACVTGRIGAWLRARAHADIDGVDLTPEMIELARDKGVYRTLAVADVFSTGL